MIGLGSYSFFWQQSTQNPKPLSLIEAFTETAQQGVLLFQICDYPQIEQMTPAELEVQLNTLKNLL
jgi:3-oxoisoapionate decarboxylase